MIEKSTNRSAALANLADEILGPEAGWLPRDERKQRLIDCLTLALIPVPAAGTPADRTAAALAELRHLLSMMRVGNQDRHTPITTTTHLAALTLALVETRDTLAAKNVDRDEWHDVAMQHKRDLENLRRDYRELRTESDRDSGLAVTAKERTTERDAARAECEREKQSRVQWQKFAYQGMRVVDAIMEKQVARGTGTCQDTFTMDCENALDRLKFLRFKLDQLATANTESAEWKRRAMAAEEIAQRHVGLAR